MKDTASAGGGANISGVLYQILWSLFRVSKIGILNFESDDSAFAVANAIVVLEPDDGGDLRIDGEHQQIEQLKARTDGSGWSLQDVITKVLPDLILAVSSDPKKPQTFRFVSEGGIGNWQTVYQNFFRDLGSRGSSPSISDLDNSKVLLTGAKPRKNSKPFFPSPCTEYSLFVKICESICERPAVKKLGLQEPELQRRVFRLLERFDFREPIKVDEIQRHIDSHLLAVVDKATDIPKIRDHLAIELAKKASYGDAKVLARDFLQQHGIDAIPLSNWSAHRSRAGFVLQKTLKRRGYDPNLNVRLDLTPELPTRGKALVIAGESGCGKSWALNALAAKATSNYNLPILIESKGNADSDIEKAAEVFWHDIHDGDELLAFSRIKKRLRSVLNDRADVGVTVIVDGVTSFQEAKALVDFMLEDGKSELVLSCRYHVAESLKQACPSLIEVYL